MFKIYCLCSPIPQYMRLLLCKKSLDILDSKLFKVWPSTITWVQWWVEFLRKQYIVTLFKQFLLKNHNTTCEITLRPSSANSNSKLLKLWTPEQIRWIGIRYASISIWSSIASVKKKTFLNYYENDCYLNELNYEPQRQN